MGCDVRCNTNSNYNDRVSLSTSKEQVCVGTLGNPNEHDGVNRNFVKEGCLKDL